MRFSATGPDIPNDLVRAQLSGDVLLIVGAGVSKRVGLPLFAGLTAEVYAKIHQSPPDRPDTIADVAEKEAWDASSESRCLKRSQVGSGQYLALLGWLLQTTFP